MKRIAFLLKVREDKIAEYVKHHESVWPEMLDALRRTGWHNYSLFMRDDGLLFGYSRHRLPSKQHWMACRRKRSTSAGRIHGALLRRPRRRACRREYGGVKEVFHLE